MPKTIRALGTDAHAYWVYIRDAAGDVWAVSRTDLSDKVIMGLARGHFEVLSDRFSINTPTNAMIGWSAYHWRSALLAEAYEAGPIAPHRLPRVRFVGIPGCFRDGDLIELPPMRSMPTKSVALAKRPALDFAPEIENGGACERATGGTVAGDPYSMQSRAGAAEVPGRPDCSPLTIRNDAARQRLGYKVATDANGH